MFSVEKFRKKFHMRRGFITPHIFLNKSMGVGLAKTILYIGQVCKSIWMMM